MKRAAFVCLLACVACSLTQSLDHLSYSEGQGGASSSGTGLASTTGSTATGAGANAASASTGGTGPGVGGQAGAGPGVGGQAGAGPGGGVPFCVEGEHAFCVDFEQGLGDWSSESVSEEAGATLGLSTERSTSPDHALRSFVPGRGDADVALYATVSKDFEGPWRAMVVDFELFVEEADWQPEDVNAGFLVFLCTGLDGLGMELSVGGSMSIGAGYISFNFSHLDEVDGLTLSPFPFGEWTHVHLEFDPRGRMEGSVGLEPFEKSWQAPVEPPETRCWIDLGISGYNDPVPDLVSFVDDVTVDFER